MWWEVGQATLLGNKAKVFFYVLLHILIWLAKGEN